METRYSDKFVPLPYPPKLILYESNYEIKCVGGAVKQRNCAEKKRRINDSFHREIKSMLLTFMQNQAYVTTKFSSPGFYRRPKD
jgi:hypothetical protein